MDRKRNKRAGPRKVWWHWKKNPKDDVLSEQRADHQEGDAANK